MKDSQKVLVIGATGGTGLATMRELIDQGHQISALVRSPEKLKGWDSRLKVIRGDVMCLQDIERAMTGQDVVIVTVGISENPLLVRLFGSRKTPMCVRSLGTQNVITAMNNHGVEKLIVQSSFGVGDSRDKLSFIDRLFFKLFLKPQIEDTEKQEIIVKSSNLQWVLIQPVHLRSDSKVETILASAKGETGQSSIARRSVAKFLVQMVESSEYLRQSVALSAALVQS